MSEGVAQRPLWVPSERRREQATLTEFMRWVGARHDRQFEDYQQLWEWSVTELEQFWTAIWEFCGVLSSTPYERVLDSHRMPGTRWFAGARLNYAENLLSDRKTGLPRPADRLAVLHSSETRQLQEQSWGELAEQVASIAAALRSLGVTKGDRVAAYMPNIPETLVAFLAAASIGAIFSSAAPEFGARSVIDRFAQIEPKVLFVIDGYRYGGRDFDRTAAVSQILSNLPTVEHVVRCEYLGSCEQPTVPEHVQVLDWDQLIERGAGAELDFEQVEFDHPLWVLYSSGTTGLPKAIVQGHGGILIEQLKKGYLHLDLHADDRMFWFTTTGWMMWNFLVGCLLTDAAIVMYDGNPAYPDLSMLFELAERARISCLGTSAGFLASAMKEGIEPRADHDLSALRSVGSTGSPLAPEAFDWVYGHMGKDLWLFSTSGGTDVCTAFVGGCPLLPVYSGELQCRALGCAVEAWDEQGNSVVEEVGELVITEPMPSMPLYFWGDEDGSRYRDSYFELFPGNWRHGDWIRITQRGGAVIYGRSDSTINRQGVRMGTSEIYRAAATVAEVVDQLVVDVPREGELWMCLFVVLRDGVQLDDQLTSQIKRAIRENCSPRHVPNDIRQITVVPRTLSGKVLEVPVKKILMGADPAVAASIDSLADPCALDYFVRLAATFAENTGAAAD